MPFGVAIVSAAAGAVAETARMRYRRTERYTLGWSPLDGNDINTVFRPDPSWDSKKMLEAYEQQYRIERTARRRQERIDHREERMSTRLERRRTAIRLKWKARARVALIGLFGVPVTLGLLALAWRAAMWALVS